MMGHKIRFFEEIWIIIPKLSLLLLLIWSPGDGSYKQSEHVFIENEKTLPLNYLQYPLLTGAVGSKKQLFTGFFFYLHKTSCGLPFEE